MKMIEYRIRNLFSDKKTWNKDETINRLGQVLYPAFMVRSWYTSKFANRDNGIGYLVIAHEGIRTMWGDNVIRIYPNDYAKALFMITQGGKVADNSIAQICLPVTP